MGYRGLLLLFFAVVCVACSPKQPQMSQDKVASDEWRMQNLEARFLEFQEKQKEREAELEGRVRELDGKVITLNQQLEEMEEQAGTLKAEAASLKEAMRAKDHMAPTVSEAPFTPVAAGKVVSKQENVTPAEPRKVSPGSADAMGEVPVSDSEETLYHAGLNYARDGLAEKGRKTLDKFLGEFPHSPYVPNALYWLGETYYHEKRYAQAILTFKEVVRRFPQHNKAPAAMLKIGFSYEQLNDISNAHFYLQTLVDEYPDSGPAALAGKRLSSSL